MSTLAPARQQRDKVPDGCPLTVAELRAVSSIAQGLTYKQTAAQAWRAVSTIRTQLHAAYQRLGVASSAQAIIACFKAGWLHADGTICKPPPPVPEEDQVTPAQALYLEAFQRAIRSGKPEDRQEASVLLRIVRRQAPGVCQ